MKVLIAIDGSDHARKAVDYVIRHQATFGGVADIACVFVDTPPSLRAVGAFGADPGMPPLAPVDPQQLAAPLLAQLAAAGWRPTLLVREGDPGLEIAQAARDGNFDMLVMGSHGRGFFKRTVLGSVASKVLASCSTPALIVR